MYDLLPAEEPGCTKVVNFLTDEERSIPASSLAEGAKPNAKSPAAVAVLPPTVLPHWLPAPLAQSLTEGTFAIAETNQHRLIVARVHNEDYAFDAYCPHHSAPLEPGQLNGYTWICPTEPGCAYDVRNGARIGGGPHLECHPVRRDDQGRVLVGFGMPFKPRMPSF